MYSPKDYWTNLAENFDSADGSGFAPILHPLAPAWFNQAIDNVQFRALRRGLALATLPSGARFLDVGCGTGRWVRRYSDLGFSPVGVDATIGMLRIARAHQTAIPLTAALAYSLPFSDSVFDAISDITVVQHIPYHLQREALREMVRVLRPGGRMILFELIRGQDSHIFPRHPRDWIRETEDCGTSLIDWFGEEFFFPDRLFVHLAQTIFRPTANVTDRTRFVVPGSASKGHSVARRLYWQIRRATVALSAWSEPAVGRVFPGASATHAIFVFRKKS
jgi:SAM-dependent methyltransferase